MSSTSAALGGARMLLPPHDPTYRPSLAIVVGQVGLWDTDHHLLLLSTIGPQNHCPTGALFGGTAVGQIAVSVPLSLIGGTVVGQSNSLIPLRILFAVPQSHLSHHFIPFTPWIRGRRATAPERGGLEMFPARSPVDRRASIRGQHPVAARPRRRAIAKEDPR